MKAPDKIYIQVDDSINFICQTFTRKPCENSYHRDVEYIRKDALLEWAKQKIAKGMIDEWDKGYVQCLKDLIDKLNEI